MPKPSIPEDVPPGGSPRSVELASNSQRLPALQAPEDLPLQEAVGRLIASIPLDDCIAIHETSRKR
jgi:hypothetical protein